MFCYRTHDNGGGACERPVISMQLSMNLEFGNLSDNEASDLEDYRGFLILQDDIKLSQFLHRLSDDDLLLRYTQFLQRNASDCRFIELEGYRHLRGKAYDRCLFDEIDKCDESTI